jgi:hypothetical protein
LPWRSVNYLLRFFSFHSIKTLLRKYRQVRLPVFVRFLCTELGAPKERGIRDANKRAFISGLMN